MVWFTLAWRNLWRQRRRSLITASAMAVGVAMAMSLICLNDGTYSKFFEVMVEGNLGHIQVHHPDFPTSRSPYDSIEGASKTLEEILQRDEVKHVTMRGFGAGLIGGTARSAGAQLLGIDPVTEAAVTKLDRQIQEGQYLDPESPAEILVGVGLLDEIESKIGDSVVIMTQASDGSIGNALYVIRGTFKTGNVGMDRAGVYLLLPDLQELLVLEDPVSWG